MTGRRTHKIGVLGTAARLALGVVMVGSVVEGHISEDFHLASWFLGLVVLPAAMLAAHLWMARRSVAPLRSMGPVGHCVALLAFVGLYLIEPTSDAALLFYGGSLLLAAARRSGGCEVLAFSNWVLGRRDEVGCVLFGTVDRLERRRRVQGAAAPVEAAVPSPQR